MFLIFMTLHNFAINRLVIDYRATCTKSHEFRKNFVVL